MNRNIEDYVKIYDVLDDSICQQTLKEISRNALFKQHNFYNPNDGTLYKPAGDEELDISHFQPSTVPIIMINLCYCLQQYINEFNFPWFLTWNGYSELRWNRYDSNRRMSLHWDQIHSLFDGTKKGVPTLSMVGSLNTKDKDYTGGEFIMFDDKEYNLKAGQVLIFPSTFMYPHKVNLVTSGTRYSFVSWVW